MKPLLSCLALAIAAVSTPRPSLAAPRAAGLDTLFITVAQDGSGDATTINAGLGLSIGAYPVVIRVMPGYYDEIVALGPPPATPAEFAEVDQRAFGDIVQPEAANALAYELVLTASNGPAVTIVRGFSPTGSEDDLISGFTVEEPVIHRITYGQATRWEDCVFEDGFTGQSRGAPNLARCTFYGPTRLNSYASHDVAFEDLHFVGGGLQLWARNEGDFGPLEFKRCTFEGPADTGVVAHPSGENHMLFEDCVFADLDYGVVAEAGCDDQIRVSRSRFFDIAQAAVFMDRAGQAYNPSCPTLPLSVVGCRFERCGQAVKWWPLLPVPGAAAAILAPDGEQATTVYGQFVGLGADTVLDCTGTAIEMRVQWGGASLGGLVVRGSGGDGIALTNVSDRTLYGNVRIENCTVESSAGSGVTLIEHTSDVTRQAPVRMVGNRVSHNVGHGFDVDAQYVEASLNVSHHNGGDGFRLHTQPAVDTPVPSPTPSDVGLQTLAFNGGAGLRHTIDPAVDPATVVLHHNLLVQNDAEGIVAGGAIRYNDAWMNPGGDYLGALIEDNLSVDPAFCDPSADDFTLILGSVCGPNGPFGQIGALGIGCAPTAARAALRAAEVAGGRVRLTWYDGLARIIDATVERVSEGKSWVAAGDIASDGTGLLRFEQPAPEPGRYGYRLVSGDAIVGEDAWVDVPEVSFAMHVACPAHGGTILVQLSLPSSESLTLDLLDVAGRRIETSKLTPQGERLSAILGRERALTPGLYLVRASQGGRQMLRRVILLR